MLILRKILFVLLVISSVIVLDLGLQTSDNYGPYTVTYGDFQLCNGPRRYNETKIETQVIDIGYSKILLVNSTHFENSRITEIRTVVYIIKGKSRTTLWDYRWREPCRYFAVSNMMQQLGFKNCIAPKGFFSYKVNLTEIMETLIGKSFFYGDYLVKSVAMSKKGNMFCSMTSVQFKKKI